MPLPKKKSQLDSNWGIAGTQMQADSAFGLPRLREGVGGRDEGREEEEEEEKEEEEGEEAAIMGKGGGLQKGIGRNFFFFSSS